MRQVIIAIETTGLLVEDGHRIIELACVELADGRPTGRVLHQYLDPERGIDAGAIAVHGITWDRLVGQPLFADIFDQLQAFIAGAQLIMHNAPFRLGFLNAELGYLFGDHMEPLRDAICTMELARRLLPGIRPSLDNLCDHFAIDRSHRIQHGALIDAQLLAQIYMTMLHIAGRAQR